MGKWFIISLCGILGMLAAPVMLFKGYEEGYYTFMLLGIFCLVLTARKAQDVEEKK